MQTWINISACPYFSVGQTLGGDLERTRAGWLGGEGDGYNWRIKDFLNTGHMIVYLTLQHVPLHSSLRGMKAFTSRINIPQSPYTENIIWSPHLHTSWNSFVTSNIQTLLPKWLLCYTVQITCSHVHRVARDSASNRQAPLF